MNFYSLRNPNLKKTTSTLLILAACAAIFIVGMTFKKSTLEVQNNVEVEVPTAEEQLEQAVQKMIDDAIFASSTEISTAKEKAGQEVEDKMKKEIETKVRASIRTKVDPD